MRIKKNRGIISGSINHRKIVWIVLAVVVAFGIYALVDMKKDEFPAFSYPQGIVAGVYPGANAEEVEAQLTKPLEELLFTLPEVDRANTYSITKEGICYVYVTLDLSASDDTSKAWTKIRQRINETKATTFPAGVLAIAVIDDFGNTSSLLIAMESADKTYREMRDYTDDLTHRLREIPQTGNVRVMGEQNEEIAVIVDKEKLSFYGISPNSLMLQYASQGLLTTAGSMETDDFDMPLHIQNPVVSEQELENQIIYSDAMGNTVRLRDVATVERRLAPTSKVVNFNGNDAIIISVEMRKGFNIVAYGREVEKALSEFKAQLPDSVHLYRITDQPKVVQRSVNSFLRDLLISMVVVIAVMLLLFPFRTALIASSGLPICTAFSIGMMYLFGIELNTVTLAALIVVLGMIVDDSIINIDGYIDKLSQGMEPFKAATTSARELFMPMFIATTAIATMFFPMTRIITGPLGDFVQLFPWTVAFSLMGSLAYAMLVIPSLEILFIKPTDKPRSNAFMRVQKRFFNFIQQLYDKMQSHCFKHPHFTLGLGLGSIALGVLMFLALNVQMMPNAERDCFAVEIRLPEGSSLEATSRISDSLQHMMLLDPRVTSITAFIGETAPRFHVTYAPSIPAQNLSQLIVNTTSKQATEDLLKEMDGLYSYYFPEAHVRFRQLDYQAVSTPVAILVFGDDYEKTAPVAQQIKDYMLTLDSELRWVHTDYDEQLPSVKVTMKPEECARLGITKGILSLNLATTLNGQPLTTIWEGSRSIPVKLYSKQNYDPNDYESVQNQLIPTMIPGTSVPLRQIADVSPDWHPAQLTHHNGKNNITIAADMKFWKSHTASMKKIENFIDTEVRPNLPEGVEISYFGLSSLNTMVIPQILKSLIAAILVLLAFLVVYFKKLNLALLTLCSSALCMFGAFFGEWLFGLDFGMTSVLGVVSLIGIIVRNGIVMYEYAETLRTEEGLTAKDAAMKAGSRRMRPIFLTSATTALGVIPMIITRNPLWMPMGVVICFGVVLSMVIILAVMPVMYWQIFRSSKSSKKEQPETA